MQKISCWEPGEFVDEILQNNSGDLAQSPYVLSSSPELNQIFNLLRKNYSGYQYFDGDSKFYAAYSEVVKQSGSLGGNLQEALSFIEDGHFLLNGRTINK
ncbi:MAG: hypothetical protein GY756_05175 [bacterium]|nr:hypothetical protein [bacterium]